MKTIEQNTCLIPYLIAESAAWEYLEDKHPNWEPMQCAEWVSKQVDWLCDKADTIYSHSPLFRKQIKSSDIGRMRLASFFYHWLEAANNPTKTL